MSKSGRYQEGTVEEKDGVWYIRFTAPDGKRPRIRIGTKAQFSTKAKAARAAQHLRDQFNSAPESVLVVTRTFRDVIAKYEQEEMPKRYSTRRGYMQMHRVHIAPKWGDLPLAVIDHIEVRAWINGLDLSSRTKGHIHAQMRVLFKFAIFWKWLPMAANPMSTFSIEGGTKRTRKPRTVSPKQFFQILRNQHDVRFRAMLIGAGCLGLRASELFALQWLDFDFLGGKLMIQRAIVDGRVGEVKTHGSEATIPLPKFAADAFLALYQLTEFKDQDDWVFASPAQCGEMPFNSQHIQYNTLREVGKGIGLDFNLGWHTFRHSFKNILKASGADPEMMRDLLRHSDTHTTMNVYGEADFDRMREASDRAIAAMLKEEQS